MDAQRTEQNTRAKNRRLTFIAGILLVGVGAMLFLDQYVDTGWLPMAVIPVSGFILLFEGNRTRQFGFLIAGSLLFFSGVGVILSFSTQFELAFLQRMGMAMAIFGFGWLGITILSSYYAERLHLWALVPAAVFFSVGACFWLTDARVVDFALYLLTAVGLALLIWGIKARLFGLIIPSALLLGIGPGIYMAWGRPTEINGLAQTGVMLVWFSLGWGLIVLFSRLLTEKFVWWPLIPGGVLAVAGWGLYIGGNPENAAKFITNTGSIGLIIFGLYLLFMRRGIHH